MANCVISRINSAKIFLDPNNCIQTRLTLDGASWTAPCDCIVSLNASWNNDGMGVEINGVDMNSTVIDHHTAYLYFKKGDTVYCHKRSNVSNYIVAYGLRN